MTKYKPFDPGGVNLGRVCPGGSAERSSLVFAKHAFMLFLPKPKCYHLSDKTVTASIHYRTVVVFFCEQCSKIKLKGTQVAGN